MNNETAKVILSAYRHDGADAQDPLFTDALQQARLDPELGKWFEEQRAFDQRIFQAAQRIKTPASLKEVLIAVAQGAKARPRSRSRIPWSWLALAAVLVIAGLVLVGPLGVNRSNGENTLAVFQQDALAMLSGQPGPKLDFLTPSLPATQDYIAKEQGPLAPTLPAALKGMHTAGCLVTEWHHYRISLTCFLMHDGQLVHLVVLPKDALAGARLPGDFQAADGWRIVYRERDGMVMFWATHAPMNEFENLLQS
ncbi:MAG: hypothetical protein JO015_21935 [Verrucomicrobia bacterium]|nr:hypothetical protein [Verrucomicrobiota bacterium]